MTGVWTAAVLLMLLWHMYESRGGGLYRYAYVRAFAVCFPAVHLLTRIYLPEADWTGAVYGILGLGVAALVLSLLCSLRLMRREGWHLRNLQSVLLCVGLIALSLLILAFSGKEGLLWATGGLIGLLLYGTGVLAASVLLGVIAGRKQPGYDRDVVLILGSQIREDGTLTPLLRGRAACAMAFARRQERETGKLPLLVPTGGQGADECIPEGDAIARYLLDEGYPKDRILAETRATGTAENLRFSRDVLSARGISEARIAFATSDFHVFRTGVLARDMGMDAAGLGSPTKLYFWVNAYAREILVMLYRDLRFFGMDIICIFALEVLSALL